MFTFLNPEYIRKAQAFLMFSEGQKRRRWLNMRYQT